MALPVHLAYSHLLLLDSAGPVLDALVDYRQRYAAGIAALGVGRALVAVPLCTTCSSGRVAVLDPYAPAIDWFDGDGDHVRRDSLELEPGEVDKPDIERWVRNWVLSSLRELNRSIDPELLRVLVEREVADRRGFGRLAPPAVSLLCDPEGALWLQEFSTDDHPAGYGRRWLVVRDGRVARRVVFSAGFQPHVIRRHTIFGVYTDSLDVEHLAIDSLENAQKP